MRNPIAPLTPKPVKPVESKPDSPAHERLPGSRSFAHLLAEAESVRDRVEVGGRVTTRSGAPGALQSAADFLVRQAPWLGLPLLLRQGPATEASSERPSSGERRKS